MTEKSKKGRSRSLYRLFKREIGSDPTPLYIPPQETIDRASDFTSLPSLALALHDPNSRPPQPQMQQIKHVKRYRGFSTSISSLFLDEEVVCWSVSCFGLLASSRTEHLLTRRNEQRNMSKTDNFLAAPSQTLGISLFLTITVISITYLIWGFGEVNQVNAGGRRDLGQQMQVIDMSGHEENQYKSLSFRFFDDILWKPIIKTGAAYVLDHGGERESATLSNSSLSDLDRNLQDQEEFVFFESQEMATSIRCATLLLFFIILGFLGRRRRMKTRFAILKARAQDDRLQFGGDSNRKRKVFVRESKYDGACSHTLCGCYPVDSPSGEENDLDIERGNGDFLSMFFDFFSSSCCGHCCKVWFQCFSMYVLAFLF